MVRRQSDPDWHIEQLFCSGDRLLHRRQRHECHRHPAARDQRRPGQDVHHQGRIWSHFDKRTLQSHRDTFRFESHRRSDVVHHRPELRRRERHVDRKFLEYLLIHEETRVRRSVGPSSNGLRPLSVVLTASLANSEARNRNTSTIRIRESRRV